MAKIEIYSMLPTKFSREVGDGEKLCPVCGGLGLNVEGNYIVTCHDCIKGIVTYCQHCKEILLRNHNCEGMRNLARKELHDRTLAKWNKTSKITLEEAYKTQEWVYVDNWDEYILMDDLEDKIDGHRSKDEDFDVKELFIYGTTKIKMSFDANSLIESACEDLHEDAGSDISSDEIKEMQDFLDNWVEEYGSNTTSYEIDYSIGVVIPEVTKS